MEPIGDRQVRDQPVREESSRQQLGEHFEAHAALICAWFRTRLGPKLRRRVDAADLAQEVWVRAARQFLSKNEQIENPRAWLLRTARYVFLENLRSARRTVMTAVGGTHAMRSIEQLSDSATRASARLVRSEQWQAMFAWVDTLDEIDRELFLLCGLEQCPTEDVAQRLGLTADNVRKRWQRLRKRLRTNCPPSLSF